MKELTPMDVAKAARSVLEEFLALEDDPVFDGETQRTAWHVNCGLCEDFAETVKQRLGGEARPELEVVWLHETLIHGDSGAESFDYKILDNLKMQLPEAYDEQDLLEIVRESAHAVLIFDSPKYGVRFYDSQALQGVRSYFDLPMMQDAVGLLDDPEVKKLKADPQSVDWDSLNEASERYFKSRKESRIRECLRDSEGRSGLPHDVLCEPS